MKIFVTWQLRVTQDSRDVRGGLFVFQRAGRECKSIGRGGVGQGEDENPRGGPGLGKKVRKSTDLKIRQ